MGSNRHMAERYARYAELRDQGAFQVDAAREIGVTMETAAKYERAWRQARKIAPRPSDAGMSPRTSQSVTSRPGRSGYTY